MLEQEVMQPKVMNAEKFSVEVERRHHEEETDQTYLEIAAAYLEELGIEPENGAPLISKSLYDKIAAEAMDRNMLTERNTTTSLTDLF